MRCKNIKHIAMLLVCLASLASCLVAVCSAFADEPRIGASNWRTLNQAPTQQATGAHEQRTMTPDLFPEPFDWDWTLSSSRPIIMAGEPVLPIPQPQSISVQTTTHTEQRMFSAYPKIEEIPFAYLETSNMVKLMVRVSDSVFAEVESRLTQLTVEYNMQKELLEQELYLIQTNPWSAYTYEQDKDKIAKLEAQLELLENDYLADYDALETELSEQAIVPMANYIKLMGGSSTIHGSLPDTRCLSVEVPGTAILVLGASDYVESLWCDEPYHLYYEPIVATGTELEFDTSVYLNYGGDSFGGVYFVLKDNALATNKSFDGWIETDVDFSEYMVAGALGYTRNTMQVVMVEETDDRITVHIKKSPYSYYFNNGYYDSGDLVYSLPALYIEPSNVVAIPRSDKKVQFKVYNAQERQDPSYTADDLPSYPMPKTFDSYLTIDVEPEHSIILESTQPSLGWVPPSDPMINSTPEPTLLGEPVVYFSSTVEPTPSLTYIGMPIEVNLSNDAQITTNS